MPAYNTVRNSNLIEMERTMNSLGQRGWRLVAWSILRSAGDRYDPEFVAVMEHPESVPSVAERPRP